MYMYTTVSINCKRETATVLINAGKHKNNKQNMWPLKNKQFFHTKWKTFWTVVYLQDCSKDPLWNIFQAICSWFSCFVVLVSSQIGAISLQRHESQHAGWFITGAIILQQHDRLRSGWFITGISVYNSMTDCAQVGSSLVSSVYDSMTDCMQAGSTLVPSLYNRMTNCAHTGWFNTGTITLQQICFSY